MLSVNNAPGTGFQTAPPFPSPSLYSHIETLMRGLYAVMPTGSGAKLTLPLNCLMELVILLSVDLS